MLLLIVGDDGGNVVRSSADGEGGRGGGRGGRGKKVRRRAHFEEALERKTRRRDLPHPS